ncbi:hypothetical protein Tco_1060858 [Tanacetum coccineum]
MPRPALINSGFRFPRRNFEDEIADVILEDLCMKYGKDDKGKEKEAKHDKLKVNKEKLKVDFTRAIKAKHVEHDKGKGKVHELDDLVLNDLDLENKIKKLEVDFEEVQISSEEFSSDEDLFLFNDVKYPLTDAEIMMFKDRPTRSRSPAILVASTSTRSKAPTRHVASISTAKAPIRQVASNSTSDV